MEKELRHPSRQDKQATELAGYFKYADETGEAHIVYIKDNIVEVLYKDDVQAHIRERMKKEQFVNDEIIDYITLKKDTTFRVLPRLKTADLNFTSWGKDYEYFFFLNCAVRVTKDGITPQRYADIPCQVNYEAIQPWSFTPACRSLFDIGLNPEYVVREKKYKEQMEDPQIDEETKDRLSIEFARYAQLWKYKLTFPEEISKMPVPLQFVYDTCRIYWEKEEMYGLTLTEEERQLQDMLFVNKVMGIGYGLSRYQSCSSKRTIIFADFIQGDEWKHVGGTGKSIFKYMLETVRSQNFISGVEVSFKPKGLSRNFSRFRDTVDSNVFIDDMPGDIRRDEFRFFTNNMNVRSIFWKQMMISPERQPKVFIEKYGEVDFDNPTLRRRFCLLPMSNYYHHTNLTGMIKERTPYTKFGKDIVGEATKKELNVIMNMLLQFCQFYLRAQEVIMPTVAGMSDLDKGTEQ